MTRWLRRRAPADRLVGLVGLVGAAPVIGLCAILVRRHDGGPAFVSVPRVGREGEVFGMWKLRTMSVGRVDGTADGGSLSGAGDPRVTSVGEHLRRWHLDELPQLVHVVTGTMALLGPRPEAPELVDRSDPRWGEVLAARPALAGITQVVVGEWEREVIAAAPDGSRYLSDVVPAKLELDRWYVRNASAGVDAQVVLGVVRHLLGRALAPRLARAVADVAVDGRPVLAVARSARC